MKFPAVFVGIYDVMLGVSSSVRQTVAIGLHYLVMLTKLVIHNLTFVTKQTHCIRQKLSTQVSK